jgi:hypothetical protein
MKTKTICPDFRVLIRDETSYWLDEALVQRCGGKIMGVYYFDANRAVYCCEMTPSYEMEFMESIPLVQSQDDRESDKVQMELMTGDAQSDGVRYIHCHEINLDQCQRFWKLTVKEWRRFLDEADGDGEKAYNLAREAIRESLQGNPCY